MSDETKVCPVCGETIKAAAKMVDIDAGGRVVAARQVLNEANFAQFQANAPGMSRDELLRMLGTPGETRHGG